MPGNILPTGLAHDLQIRANLCKPIRISLVGSGEMGTDIVTRVAHTPEVEIGVISEWRLPAAAALPIHWAQATNLRPAWISSSLSPPWGTPTLPQGRAKAIR
jgi:hypothetical protein